MDKKELQEQYEKLSDQITKMLDEAEKLKEKIDSMPIKNERYKPMPGYWYWYIANYGEVTEACWDNDNTDLSRHSIGNCFKTEEEAKQYRENLLTKQQLKDLALELNNGIEVNWNSFEQDKYYIFTHYDDDNLYQSAVSKAQALGQVYCLDKDFLDVAKERIGEEKLIKLIKSGV